MNEGRRMALWTVLAAGAGLLIAFAAGVLVGVTVADDDGRSGDAVRLTLEDGALSIEGLDNLDLGDFDLDLDLDLGGLGEGLRERLDGLRKGLPGAGGAVLGVSIEASDAGVTVARVTPGGPAEDAGVLTGDVIESVDGSPVATVDELRAALGALPADLEAYELALRRGDRTLAVEVERRAFVGADPGSLLGRLFDGAPGLDDSRDRDGPRRWEPAGPELQRFLEQLGRGGSFRLEPQPGDRFRFEAPPGSQGAPSSGVTPEQLERELDRVRAEFGAVLSEGLREVLAEALEEAGRGAQPPTPAVPAPLAPSGGSSSDAEATVYFGRVAELSGDSIVLTGSRGPVTLAVTSATEFPAGRPAIDELVTAVAVGGVARTVAVVR